MFAVAFGAWLAIAALDAGMWILLRRYVHRLAEWSLGERLLAVIIIISVAVVCAAIPIGVLGAQGIPLSLAAGILGAEIGLLINLRSIWAADLWSRLVKSRRRELRNRAIRRGRRGWH